MKHSGKKLAAITLSLALLGTTLAGCGNEASAAPGTSDSTDPAAATEQKTYYYVAPGLGQPFTYDMILGFKYAAAEFGCKIIPMGADDWNSQTACAALEQVIPKKPDGIITAAWDAAMNPGIEKAMDAGIPVILVEAHSGNPGNLYIGLDNVDTGRETADELLNLAGDSGKLLVIGNWGSTNIDEKYIGLKEVLGDTGWEILGDQDSNAAAETALQAAKDLLSNHPDATAFVGLDSACGAAIATAMEELNMDPGSITVICADREDAMLEYIKSGYIQASLTNRTAGMCYMAVQYLESVTKYGFLDVPITGDNAGSDVSPYPVHVSTGNVVITKENVDNFDHNQMDTYDTPLYG